MKIFALVSSLLMISFVFSSCVREEIISIPHNKVEPTLVVFGFLTPSDKIHVYVGRTQPFGKFPILKEDFKELNATVILKNEAGEERMLTKINEDVSMYATNQEDFPIEKGKSYFLHVEAPDYPAVSSMTTVPIERAVWKSTALYPEDYEFVLKGTWDALPEDYEVGYEVSTTGMTASESMRPSNGIIVDLGATFAVQQDVFFSYEETQRKAILITQDKKSTEFRKIDAFTLDMLYMLDHAYFTDLISGYKGIMPQGGNIKNGHGVFGAYLVDSKIIYKPKDAN